jgi:hypothetical protein
VLAESIEPTRLAALGATDRPFQPAECADRARRATELVDVAALPATGTGESVLLWQDEYSVARTPGPPDEGSPASPRLLASFDAVAV